MTKKTKRAVYFIREVREIFDRTRPFGTLTIYVLVQHMAGKHHVILEQEQAAAALYGHMTAINRSNGQNRSSAIPVREGRDRKLLKDGEKGGKFCGIRRIPPTPEGRDILFAYRQGRMDDLNKLLAAQYEIIEADKKKGILTGGQVARLIGTVTHALELTE